jgi:hypothetical protein
VERACFRCAFSDVAGAGRAAHRWRSVFGKCVKEVCIEKLPDKQKALHNHVVQGLKLLLWRGVLESNQ